MALTILITGSTDGIGLASSQILASKGHRVLLHGRNESKAKRVANRLKVDYKVGVKPVWGDLSVMREVTALSRQIKNLDQPIDVLINNAGIYLHKKEITPDGFEKTIAVNHFAVQLLTNLLLKNHLVNDCGRIIIVSSVAHKYANLNVNDLDFSQGFTGFKAYATSKLANILFTKDLAKRLSSTNITVNSLHPGVIDTKLLRSGFDLRGADVNKGSETSVFLALSPEISGVTGQYFVDCKKQKTSTLADSAELASSLWERSEEKLKNFYS